MVAVALLSNPRSTGNRQLLPRVRSFCANHPDIFHYEVESVEQISRAMQMIAHVKPTVIVINGGDGSNQHPTQTLLDLFSIHETQGKLDGLNVAFVGDLKYGRTVHSLAQALSLFNCRFFFISPEALAMPDYLCEELEEKGIQFSVHETMEEVMPELDILYMTRVQKERFDETEYKHMAAKFVLELATLEGAKPTMKILHPLPRVDEIDVAVDKTPHAYYFQQAENGVYARQALLALVLNETV